MKKLLLTMLLIGALSLPSSASMVIIDYQGDTVVHQQTVERNLIINSDDDAVYNIAIRPLDDALRRVDGEVAIPLSNLYINNTREDVYLRYNEYSYIFEGLSMGGVAKNMTAKIRDFGMVPAGTYQINFEVQATDVETGEIAATSTFCLQFLIPTIQEISLHGEVPRIKIGTENAFNKTQKVVNETSPMIYINSNSNWELVLKSDNYNNSIANYYIRTIAASSKVTERLQERVLIIPEQELIIARGKAPSNNEYVTVEYSIENKNGKIIKAGQYENKIKYILRESR